MARKVNTEAKEEKKQKRADFSKADAKMVQDGKVVKATDKAGQLLACPKPIVDGDKVVYEGFDYRKHKPLKKTDFATMADYLEFQAFVARQKAAHLIALAEDREAKAERIRKYGDESTRKKVEKLMKLRERLAAYEAALSQENIDIPEDE